MRLWFSRPTLGFAFLALGLVSVAHATPPTWSWNAEISAVGRTEMAAPGRVAQSSTSEALSLSGLHRQSLSGPWYFGWGGQFEKFRFPGHAATALPRQLQDVAAQFSLSYFENDEVAAEVNLRPGWYYGSRFTSRAWDVPFDAVTGVPIVAHLEGVIGISNARFYHHAIPIAGLVWTPHPKLRVEAAYPEPSITFTCTEAFSVRLAGQLTGGGFLDATSGRATALEYSSYRTGVTVEWKGPRGLHLTLASGVEAERSFDRFHRDQRWEGHGAAYGRIALELAR